MWHKSYVGGGIRYIIFPVRLSMDDSLIKPMPYNDELEQKNAENNWKKQHRIDLSNIKSENQLIQGDNKNL